MHVFCPENAAQVIKSYSPELIVHPLLLVQLDVILESCDLSLLPVIRSSALPERDVVDSITAWFPRLHSLIFGPGLGRDPLVLARVKKLILAAKEMQKNIVIDAVRIPQSLKLFLQLFLQLFLHYLLVTTGWFVFNC